MISVEVDPEKLGLKEEWASITTVYDNGFGREYDPPEKSYSMHESERVARRYKEWREAKSGRIGGSVWPRVTIRLRKRYVSAWEEVD